MAITIINYFIQLEVLKEILEYRNLKVNMKYLVRYSLGWGVVKKDINRQFFYDQS